jgi:Icc-related predicted phosphoesterase
MPRDQREFFKKFSSPGKFYRANAVILAGDITGK